jgi:hypothetical protein
LVLDKKSLIISTYKEKYHGFIREGWWQANERLGMPGYDPFSATGSNYNLLIGNDALDPISGSVPHRSYLCEVSPPTPGEGR